MGPDPQSPEHWSLSPLTYEEHNEYLACTDSPQTGSSQPPRHRATILDDTAYSPTADNALDEDGPSMADIDAIVGLTYRCPHPKCQGKSKEYAIRSLLK